MQTDDLFNKKKKYERFPFQAGDVYGRLTLTGMSFLKPFHKQRKRVVEAVCQCGDVRNYWLYLLRNGETKSCGCYRQQVTGNRARTHGLTEHPLWDVHQAMIKRCYSPNDPSYKNYGGRGIEVWFDWREDFVVFYDWAMANGYEKGKMLDRTDNDDGYFPSNCKFTTRGEQNRNRRNNIIITAFGEEKCLWDWGADKRCKVGVWGLRSRLDSGKWADMEKMITTPPTKRKDIQRNMKSNRNLTAFGETKCLNAWLEDPRCTVKVDSLRDRLAKGWDDEKAISFPRREI